MSVGRALIIGWGSIGRQHAAALSRLGYDCAAITRHSAPVTHFASLAEGLSSFAPDYVIVANPTAQHLDTVAELAANGFTGKVLIEKPLFDHPAPLPANTFSKIAVGYQLRFHPVLVALRKIVGNARALSCHCYCGQYLPDWRPDQDYRKSYSASREAGGGVLRDLSHEIDYLLWLFGAVNDIKALGGKYSTLEITSEDTVGVVCSLEKCAVATVQLNYCDRIFHRDLVVTTDTHTVTADLRAWTLSVSGAQDRTFNRVGLLEAMHSSVVSTNDSHFCTPDEGLAVLRFIEKVDQQLASP